MKEGSMRGNMRDIKSKRPRIMDMPQKQNIEDIEFLAMPCRDDYIISKITMQDVYNKIKDMAIRDGEVTVEINDNNFVVRKAIESTIKK